MMTNFPDIEEYEYKEFIRPSKLFKSGDELRFFLMKDAGLTNDQYNSCLNQMLSMCIEDQHYEFCNIIKDYMK